MVTNSTRLLFISIGGENTEIPMESLRKHLPDSTNPGKFKESVDPDLRGQKLFSVNSYFFACEMC